jgi:hypothetical protein
VLAGKSLFFFSLFLALGARASVSAPVAPGQKSPGTPAHLNEGAPGCWDKFHGGAMTSEEINQLALPCKNFRSDYFASVAMAQKNPSQFEKKLVQALNSATRSRAPYEAIFLATVIQTPKLKAALQKRAAIEKKLKVAFPYAEVASYRLSGKDCGANPEFLKLAYSEICLGRDSILPVYFRSAN